MFRRLAVTVCVAVTFASLVACGSESSATGTTSSSVVSAEDAQSFCASYCGRLASCDSRIDADTCAAECEDVTSSAFRRLRKDIITPTRECFEASDCRQILGGKRLSECIEESAVMVAPSAAATSFCDTLVSEMDRCDAPIDRVSCLQTARIFGDEALANAKACTEKSCSAMASCVNAELALN